MLTDATLREQLAAMAMQGILASDHTGAYATQYRDSLARLAFAVAEAMIAESRRRKDRDAGTTSGERT